MHSATLTPLDYDLELISTIYISHSKNSILPLLIAALLIDDISLIEIDGDHIDDVRTMIKIIKHLGAHCIQEKNRLIVDARGLKTHDASTMNFANTRYSLLLLGALSARLGKAKVNHPGGCDLKRPFDFHIDLLKHLGCKLDIGEHTISCQRTTSPRAELTLPYPSVGATLQAIFYSAIGDSQMTITIHNTALEPEIDDVISFLNKAGAKIFRNGKNWRKNRNRKNEITINGFKSLSSEIRVNVSAPDLRGGMAIIILAISCGCNINITSFNQILRGYTRIISNAYILGGAINHD
ncbi:UDP-N-acetylglucosamine 1-carboxyvinyltransferase 1 [compost metagenome]